MLDKIVHGGKELQEQIGCKCQYDKTCDGFCTFPSNKSLNIPSGLIFDNNRFIEIPSANFDRYLYVNDDISVNDDLEIYYVPSDKVNIIKNNLQSTSINKLLIIFKAIFQGFGDFDGTNVNRPEFLPRNNTYDYGNGYYLDNHKIAEDSPFNVAHIIKSRNIINRL